MQEYHYIWKGEAEHHEEPNKQTLINEGHSHEITEERAREQLAKVSEISKIIEEVTIYPTYI